MLLDLIFPKRCVGCSGEGNWLCFDCFMSIEAFATPRCADCKRLTSDGRYCRTHAKDHRLTGLLFVGEFPSRALREAIHVLKYNGVQELAIPLSYLLVRRLSAVSTLERAVVIPVPLHPAREAERGFNQAVLLTQLFEQEVATNVLVRYRKTKPQASLDQRGREVNLQGAFALHPEGLSKIKGKTIILVDDVSTTGSTLDMLAALLKSYGAKQVWGLVVAKG